MKVKSEECRGKREEGRGKVEDGGREWTLDYGGALTDVVAKFVIC